MGVNLSVPDHSTLSRRLGKLEVELPIIKTGFSRHVVVDSTGVKVYEEGEWQVRQHGSAQRRTWRKLHLGVDEATGEILTAMASTNNVSDGAALPELLQNIVDEIEQVSADGAYDQRSCYDAIADKQARAAIPPRQGARIQNNGVMLTHTQGMKISDTFIKSDELSGNARATTTGAQSLKTLSFVLKVSLSGKLRRLL